MAEQGQGWHGDSEGHAKAGKQGGDKVANERGSGFYEEIGSEGGSSSQGGTGQGSNQNTSDNGGQFEPGTDRAREEGRKGGEASR